MAARVFLLPGWQGSGPTHWQMRWAQRHGHEVVVQADWHRPKRGDWLARLDEVMCDLPEPAAHGLADVVLVAHSLGCIQVAAWAAVSRHVARVRGALLVAPGDTERPDVQEMIPGWAPIVRQRLPFPSILVSSQNDPFCSEAKAQALARDWGAQWQDAGPAGHINADSGLGDWAWGHQWVQTLAGAQTDTDI